MKRLLALLLVLVMVFSLTACQREEAKPAETDAPATEAPATEAASEAATEAVTDAPAEMPYVAVVSKGFQHQFWQVVKKGAEQAGQDLGVEVSFDGPPSESDINIQVDMLKNSMTRNPAAIALAALDTSAVLEQLNEAKNKGIPVVGFDSGVPDAPEGSIYATASTDNYAAAELAADELFKSEVFQAKLASGEKLVVGVLSQDATSESITKRTAGFVDKLVALVEATDGFAGAVEVVGHTNYAKAATADVKLTIDVNVPATPSATDMKSAADTLLAKQGIVAIYGSNEGAANGILSASSDGSDFNKENGKFKDILAIGFDAGKTQKTAVTNGWFYGSITQDPYQIGYQAVKLAVDAINGVPAESPIVDTGAKFYNKDNITLPEIDELVYE